MGRRPKRSPLAGILPQSKCFQRNCCIFRINLECFCLTKPLPTTGPVKPSTLQPTPGSSCHVGCFRCIILATASLLTSFPLENPAFHPSPACSQSCVYFMLTPFCSNSFHGNSVVLGSWALSAVLFCWSFSPQNL